MASQGAGSERDVLVVSTAIKALLLPAYRSTDFEVHRNWLAITQSLPLTKWYYDETSQWTLDYPPFFAYFERFWSGFAAIIDPRIVELSAKGFDGWSAIAFQRATVILSELTLAGAMLLFARRGKRKGNSSSLLLAASVILHPGLIIVDHIHFQYNGFLLGILSASLLAAQSDHLSLCALLFAVLLNFKHIFMYIAPAFGIFLLRRHCFDAKDGFVQLAVIVTSVCAASFGPFVAAGGPDQLKQILARLFPFQRGLNHAYWAGNAWALATAADRILVKYLTSRGLTVKAAAIKSASRGLIGDTTFGVLPQITPTHCFAITASLMAIYMTRLWFDPSYKRFVMAVTLSAYSSFLFGWHVHEKAVLLFLVPQSLLAGDSWSDYRSFVIASTAGIFGLFPLLTRSDESAFKLLYSALWMVIVYRGLRSKISRPTPSFSSAWLTNLEDLYLFSLPLVQLYVSIVHPLLFPSLNADVAATLVDQGRSSRKLGSLVAKVASRTPIATMNASLEFLPLMITSVVTAVGLIWSWLRLSYAYLLQ